MADVETIIRLELVPHVLTRAQVAALLQVPEDTVENLHRTGQLSGLKIGKHLRWWPDNVRKFAEALARNERGG